MITLLLGFHATSHRVHFATRAAADMALAELQLKMGGKRYGENGERIRTHMISAPEGEIVVDLDKLELARIIDTDIHADLTAEADERFIQKEIAMRTRLIQADEAAKALSGRKVSE